jgi:uncharacterized delta-60 repeat protein
MMKRSKRGCPTLETLEGRALLTAGALDTTIGGTGIVTHDIGSNTPPPPAVAIQPWDGKAVIALNGNSAGFELARYNPDGSLDTAFGKGGLAIAPFSGGGQYLAAVAVDPTTHDVYAVGSGPGGKTVAVARFTPAGALDSTFSKGGEVTVAASKPYLYSAGIAAAVDSSGRLVVAGNTTTYDAKNYFYPSVGLVYRFTTTGALDKTFNGTGKVVAPYFDDNDGWNVLQLEPSGSSYQIAVAGVYDHNNTLAVYNANGTPVTSIGSNGVAVLNANNPDDGYLFQFQPDGRLIELQSGGTAEHWTLSRYNANGTPDATFGTGGQVSLTTTTLPQGTVLNSIAVDLSGRIVLGGGVPRGTKGYLTYNGLLVQLTPTGATDTTFGTGGLVTQAIGSIGNDFSALAVYPAVTSHAGEILAAGFDETAPAPSPYFDLALALYQSDSNASTNAVGVAATGAAGAAPQIGVIPPSPADGSDLVTWLRPKNSRKV